MFDRRLSNFHFLIAAFQILVWSSHANPSQSNSDEIFRGKSGRQKFSTHVPRDSAKGHLSHGRIMRRDRVDSTQLHDLIFVIQQRNIDTLTEILHDISDPMSSNYGKYMTRAEIAELTSNPDARDHVLSYVVAAGGKIVSETLYGDYITASAPVSVWEKMLDTEFFTYSVLPMDSKRKNYDYERDESIRNYIRAEKYSVPMVLDAHVQSISNTIQLPPIMTQKQRPTTVHDAQTFYGHSDRISTKSMMPPTGYIFPAYLNSVYNIDSNVGHPLATQALFGGYDQSFSPEDVAAFQAHNFLPYQPVSQSLGNHSQSSAWCLNNLQYCSEGNLDIQYIMAVSQSPTIYYYTDLGLTSTWLIEVASLVNPPLVISISYGIEEYYLDSNEMDAFNIEAMKLSAMGVTIISSSGDDGANSWTARESVAGCEYRPIFPCTSPYVLSVGGTQVSNLSD